MKSKLSIFSICSFIFSGVILLSLGGCRSDEPFLTSPEESGGDPFTISGTLNIPDLMEMQTRGGLGDRPNANLKLTILEFDKGPDASQSNLSNIYNAELTTTTGVENGATVTFNVTLKSATTAKILHLMVSDNYLSPGYGSEATILPSLSVGSAETTSREAYWGMVEFPEGYATIDDNGDPQPIAGLADKLKNVPVIRNFAKISVTENLDNFELLGFELVNVPTSGTIAPWNQTSLSIPNLLDAGEMKSYPEITNSEQYSGITPGGTQFRNTEAEAKNWADGPNSSLRSTAARYLYEHPYESTRRTYLIINGNYNNGTSWQQGFYKIDIGTLKGEDAGEEAGTFDYYNIIRNINYNVRITEVLAPGTATVAEAISRAPFNNLIAATETSSMLNVSDGLNMLIINDNNHIIVDASQEVTVLYRYIEDVTGSKTQNNSVPHTVGLAAGPVIKSFTEPEVFRDANGTEWMKISIIPNDPTVDVKTQNFTIVDGNGLGRTISLVLRLPWQYSPIVVNGTDYSATIAKGHDDLYQGAPEVISAAAGEELTVYFNLPDGLPESMFPLDFQLEAKNQGVENNKMGTLLVHTGPSLFDPSKIAISYIKQLSYKEYLYNYVTGTNDVDVNSPNTRHTVRCRFTTITAVNDNDAEIMIYNPYFSPNASVRFERR